MVSARFCGVERSSGNEPQQDVFELLYKGFASGDTDWYVPPWKYFPLPPTSDLQFSPPSSVRPIPLFTVGKLAAFEPSGEIFVNC